MQKLRAFLRALMKRRTLGLFRPVEAKFSFFTPSDWFVVGFFAAIMALAAGTLFAAVSLAMTTEVPARGGTYVEGEVGTPRFVNPLLSISDTDRDLSALVYSGLLKANPDGSLSPDLASDYSISGDKRTYTFTLKDNARFQDGTPVTADDVAFTVREAQNPDIKSPVRANWEGVIVEVVDPKTVAFTLKAPYAPFLENATLGILPKHLWGSVTAEEFPFSTLNQRPVGSGPYEIKNTKQNSSGIPTEYDLAAFAKGTRIPYIRNFVFKFYPDASALENAFNRGEVAAGYNVTPANITAPHTIHEAVYGRVFAVFFNQNQNQIFADQAVRQALDTAVDKQALVGKVLNGYGSAISGPLPPDSIGTNQASVLSASERVAAAQAILAKDGWKQGTDGIFAKQGTNGKKKTTLRLAFSITTSNDPSLKSGAEAVASEWKALGADVSLKFYDQNDLTVNVLKPRTYDALLFGLVVGRGMDLYPFWDSSQRNDPGLNVALYANANVDKLIEAARADEDPVTRREKEVNAAKTISSETAAVFLYTPHFVYLSAPNAKGIAFGTIGTPSDRFDSVDQWFIATERLWPIFTMDWHTFITRIFPNA
ncbi:MAG: peptide ABC transporter substrate-binding protein [Patescibacteria group bacterium]|nr:peptide ABC transporter substrate-binding protein [Patescibacteria group bacterium]